MYIIKEDYLEGVNKGEKEARMELVSFLKEWVLDVYKEASREDSISKAGRVIRYRVGGNPSLMGNLFREVVLVDMGEFWKVMKRENGNRDDIVLYGMFCMIFRELDEDIEKEAEKFEGEIGFAPRLRLDIAEREQIEEEGSRGILGLFNRKKEDEGEQEKGKEEQEKEEGIEEGNEDIVEVGDNIVREDNVQLLTKVVVGVIVVLIIAIAWVVII